MLNHPLRDDVLMFSVWWSLKEFILWRLSGESQSSKSVHDHVYPQELDSSQRRVGEYDSTNKGYDQSQNIDSELELQETSDVVINITSPLACSNNRGKVIILDDDISGSSCYLCTSLHSKTNISFFEGWGIISTVTSYCYNVSKLFETSNHDVFVSRS